MRFFRRSLIALGVAATLPTVLSLAIGAFIFLRAESRRIETQTLARAELVTTLVDARLRGDAAVLNVLTGSSSVESRNWAEYYERVKRARLTNPHWITIVLFDAVSGTPVFDLRQPLGAATSELLDPAIIAQLQASGGPVIGNVRSESEAIAFVYAPVIEAGAVRYVLAAGIRPQSFQAFIEPQGAEGAVVALVDRDGHFVARSLDSERRVGQPATQYVREAIRRGPQGFYPGRTYEGLRNYTAYYVSPWSGWSTHIAIASALIDSPTSWSSIVAVSAGLSGVVLACVLIVLVLRDIAERRRAEEMLRQSQKMEAIGQLTGGIAHDFNNLLTAIIGNLDLIWTRAAGNERVQRLAGNALEAARRGAKLSSQLLAFSRNQRLQLAPVSVSQLLKGMVDLIDQSVGPTIQVRTHLDPDCDSVLSDPNQLELALLNLAVNARDAMPGGGEITIETRPASYRDVRDLAKRAYVEISVKDSGSGMSDDVRARAMEPFFTTKPVGQGTGLGLSQVYGVVRESGGLILIDSAPGEGTTIRLILPAGPPPIARADDAADPSPTLPSPSSNMTTTVLVVDDDSQVRRFIAEALRSQGYAVTDVASGVLGLEALRSNRFDLLVADFAMPGMNGADLVRAAKKAQSDLRVLMVSGYADSAALDEVLDGSDLLRKPFAVAELILAVARALGARTSKR